MDYVFYFFGVMFALIGDRPPSSQDINQCFTAKAEKAVYYCQELLKSGSVSSPKKKFIIYVVLGEHYLVLNQDDKALAAVNNAIELRTDIAHIYALRSSIFLRKRDFKRALMDIDKAIEAEPGEAGYYTNKGLVYRRQGDFQKALELYNKSIKINPGIAVTYNNRGYIYRELKEYKKAIADFRRALKIDPNDAIILHSIGEVTYEQGDHEEAVKIWKSVCQKATRRMIYGLELDLHKFGFLKTKPDEICNDETIEAFKLCTKAKCIIGSD